jgi:hypothetical protein
LVRLFAGPLGNQGVFELVEVLMKAVWGMDIAALGAQKGLGW